jgi:hypothetical protein
MTVPPGPPHDDDQSGQQGDSGGSPGAGWGQVPAQPPGPSWQPPGAGYGYPPQGPYPPYGTSYPSTNGKATASLITGIATLVLSWCCGLGLAGIVAVVLGIRARGEIRDSGGAQGGDGMALGGIVTGAIAAVVGLAGLVLVIVLIATGQADFSTTYEQGTNT